MRASGWSISAYATPFTDAGAHVLPNPRITAGSATATTGTCVLPVNAVSYPTGAIGTSGANATKIFNAATGTGSGASGVSLTFALSVPANQLIGSGGSDSFSSTVTFTAASGP